MIITTTPSIEGREIDTYFGVIFGEIVSGASFIKDIGASFVNLVGGRSYGYEEEFTKRRHQALEALLEEGKKLGADAILGVKIDYETLGTLFIVVASGTAVKLK